jgi:Holliday junction DNA helicase RuvB
MTFDKFVGQKKLKSNLSLIIDAAKSGRIFPHLGLYGPPGSGKTTLAELIAKNLGAELIYINGSAITSSVVFRKPIIKAVSSKGKDRRYIVMVDECHAMPKKVQNSLLSVLEKPAILCTSLESKLKLPNGQVLNKGEILKERMPDNISFIFCTTDKSQLSDAMESRLHPINIEEYSLEDKVEFVDAFLKSNNILLENDTDYEFISKTSKNMRHLSKICDRIMDWCAANNKVVVTANNLLEIMEILGLDEYGCDENDRKYIGYVKLQEPVSLSNIGRFLSVPDEEVKSKIEPFLIRKGWITITSKGRVLTKKCLEEYFKQTVLNISDDGVLEICQ